MKTKIILLFAIMSFLAASLHAQLSDENHSTQKHFIGSTLFLVYNLFPNPPSYYQINYGYRINPKNVISIEAITWTYKGPLGIPYGPDYGSSATNYPGSVTSLGIGLAYKRFLWKRMYTSIHATPFMQTYKDANKKKMQKGFQLFNTLRFGYQFKFFNNRIFLEPSIAFTNWPINTNLPDSFKVEEDKWAKYFLFEPGLHFGVNF